MYLVKYLISPISIKNATAMGKLIQLRNGVPLFESDRKLPATSGGKQADFFTLGKTRDSAPRSVADIHDYRSACDSNFGVHKQETGLF
jgi:hypothetical protein